jgi:hypothetical protein
VKYACMGKKMKCWAKKNSMVHSVCKQMFKVQNLKIKQRSPIFLALLYTRHSIASRNSKPRTYKSLSSSSSNLCTSSNPTHFTFYIHNFTQLYTSQNSILHGACKCKRRNIYNTHHVSVKEIKNFTWQAM